MRPAAAPPPVVVNDLEILFRGFADPTRIRLLNLLASGELCVCDLVGILGLPQSTVSRHLSYLLRCGLIEVRRGPRFAHYRLAAPSNPVHATILKCVRTCFRGIGSLDAERTLADACIEEREERPC